MTLSNARFPAAGALLACLGMAGCAAIDDDYDESEGDEEVDLDQVESQIATVFQWPGESFPMNAGYPNVISSGWGAWGNAFRQMNWTGGGAVYAIYPPRDGWYRTRVRVAGSTCDGYPQIHVCLFAQCDAFNIGTGWSHQVGTWRWLRAGFGGSMSIHFANDYARSGCDRNIWFDHAWIEQY